MGVNEEFLIEFNSNTTKETTKEKKASKNRLYFLWKKIQALLLSR